MIANANEHADSQEREWFIRDLIRLRYGRNVTSIARLSGGINCFVYSLTISATDASSHSKPSDTTQQPGVTPLPNSVADLVIRLSNVDSGLNETVRVQNEVAMMILAREALASFGRRLVPAVHGWAPGDTGMGWTLCERLPGVPLSESSITGYGRLGFDTNGNIVNGLTAIPGGGPCKRHPDLYAEYLQTQIHLSKKCDIVQGWIGTDLPARIERVRDRLTGTTEWEKSLRPTLTHADFDTHNMLFDPETNLITGLIDYDFGHVGSQADEYFYSICRLGYLVLPVPEYENDENQQLLASSILNGFDHIALAGRPNQPVDWELVRMVDEELAKAGVERPQDIPGMEEISLRYWFVNHISPPYYHTEICREAPREEKEAMRKNTQKELEHILKIWRI